ncbi:MAG: sigma-54-dependent Fis family transcriptional regulator [Aquabacterium sp.]|jgi:two-component system response regulator AtoC|nr:MAG: sigma-54-dependent Fis family transcriptional regulator [Aquabacterium sp.]
MPHALIVDDEADSAEMLAALISTEGFTVSTAGSLRDARRQLALQEPELLLLDLMLPDGSGMQLFDDTKALANTEVVLITGHASLETSIQALRMGAADYLVKPVNMKQLHGILSRVTKPSALKAEVRDLEDELEREGHFGLLWGQTAVMRRVYEQISRVAGTGVTVFITGESGTGKEVVASTVHDLSRRRGQPFLAVNCGAISPHLIESEIFGHEKGSFTGADRQHRGFFERASGGTLFLDEITEMPLDLQVKLLRVLETGTFMRVGSTQVQETDVRIIAATNRSPAQAVGSGKLREDLLYRLNVFPIHLPPLRERAEDVPLIARHFLADISRREGQTKQFAPEALSRLAAYPWPGNVRELRNIVHRAYVMAPDSVIVDECLPTSDAPLPVMTGAPVLTIAVGTPLAEVEKRVTLATLEYLGRHKEKTAATLGVSLKTLYNRLKEYSTVPQRLEDDGARQPERMP